MRHPLYRDPGVNDVTDQWGERQIPERRAPATSPSRRDRRPSSRRTRGNRDTSCPRGKYSREFGGGTRGRPR